MELETLVNEYASVGVGEHLYQEILRTVRAVVLGHRYPPSYSPTGRWDEDAFTALAHDWIVKKLFQYHQLEHLLLANQTVRGFRKGLELSFVDFLISQKKRTALDNLFQRANDILENDARFRCFVDNPQKANRLWGLASWERAEPYQGPEEDLIAAGLRLQDFTVIRYRGDAKKLSPIISRTDLAGFLTALFERVGSLLSLSHLVTIFKYRFNLLEATEVSFEEPIATDADGHTLRLGDTISDGTAVDEAIVIEEVARSLLQELPNQQQQVLVEYAQPSATLTSVAGRLGCSKSTVDNELRRVMRLIRDRTETLDQAQGVYDSLLEMLSSD